MLVYRFLTVTVIPIILIVIIFIVIVTVVIVFHTKMFPTLDKDAACLGTNRNENKYVS